MSQEIKIESYCRYCGSTEIYWDAYAWFNPESQENELVTTFDDHNCNHCGKNKCMVSRDYTPPVKTEVQTLLDKHVAYRKAKDALPLWTEEDTLKLNSYIESGEITLTYNNK